MIEILPGDDFGDFLKTRFQGERLRHEIEGHLKEGREVKVDFSGVTGMTHSFADECFGDLFSESGADLFRTRLHLREMQPPLKAVLRLVISDRSRHAAS